MSNAINIHGYFKGINKYNQLEMILDETQAAPLLLKEKNLPTNIHGGKSPLSKWTGDNGKIRYSLRLALLPKDKNVTRNFQSISNKCGNEIKFTAAFSTYDFIKDTAEERIRGWKLTLSSPIHIVQKQEEEAPLIQN